MRIIRNGLAITLSLILVTLVPVIALAETSFDGTVVSSESVSVTAPFGGTISAFSLRAGGRIAFGEAIVTIETTKVYAPESGVVTGVFGQPGDSVETVGKRYNAVLYIASDNKYTISADIEKAYNSSATKYVNIGEAVYITCASDGAHKAEGIIKAVDGTKYTVETTSGELLMEETVNIHRQENRSSASRVGRGTVSRTGETAVTGTGSILFMHVADGDAVARGDLLFETVEDTLDGLYAVSNEVVSDVSGVIASVDVAAGAKVSKGATLITVNPDESMQIEFSVNEYDLGSVTEGASVDILFNWEDNSGKIYKGTVAMISHVSSAAQDSSEATYKAYADFEAEPSVRLGMTVVVYINIGDAEPGEEFIDEDAPLETENSDPSDDSNG
jgi:multidrug resistance efflux pump